MKIRMSASPEDVKFYTTKRLRDEFLIDELFIVDEISLIYSHIDRIIVGGIMPSIKELPLVAGDEIRAEYFLERREMGVINIGGDGYINVDGEKYMLKNQDGMYIGRGSKNISFGSADKTNPAKFYLNSVPAHKAYPTVLIKLEGEEGPHTVIIKEENKVELGSLEQSNHRVIKKYILPGQVESCQLVMGMTSLVPGSVWNTMPGHTHDRRMEVYLYFGLEDKDFVMHYMGEPEETRHIVVRNEQAVISPSWSIHAGSGSRNYTFIWGMAVENQDFNDMDSIDMTTFK